MCGVANHYIDSIRQELIRKAWAAGDNYKQDISRDGKLTHNSARSDTSD